MKQFTLIAVMVSLLQVIAFAQKANPVEENVIVFKEKNRFAGWPANNGIWSWSDEIVVGFTLGYHDDKKREGHPIDGNRPITKRQARSLDGGKTWTIETPSYLDSSGREAQPSESPGGIDFTHPDFALLFLMEGSSSGFSRVYFWKRHILL